MNYKLIKYSGRPCYVVRYIDASGAPREKSSGKESKRAAERWAAKFILDAGQPGGHVSSWAAFRARYEAEHLIVLASAASYRSALTKFEQVIKPAKLADATSASLARFRDRLIQGGAPRTTAASYCKHVRAAVGWAARQGLLPHAPTVRAGSTATMRGRPLATEEFERMLRCASQIVGRNNADR